MAINVNITPNVVTTTLASAVTSAGSMIYNLQNIDRASLQLHATLTGTNTDVVTLTCSNDGVNFSAFSTAKTVTFTGGGTVDALFDLDRINYVFLKVGWGAPSASTLTLVATLNAISTQVQQA
jgi:hypothetical protein